MVAPRLHVLTATETDYAVILRRGPTRHVACIGWHRARDSFELGQWLHGRIYEHRSDLSPDGRHLIYFAGKGGAPGESAPWWTAISRAPHLHAIAFQPRDSTWGGGGAFTDRGEVFLNGGTLPGKADGLVLARSDAMPHSTDGFHMGGLHAAMMQRRGWESDGAPRYDVGLTRKVDGGWRIDLRFELQAENRSIISSRYAMVSPRGERVDYPDWEWADTWGDGVQFAAEGAVHFARIGNGGALRDHRVIRDFTDMTFERIRAPYDTRGEAGP